MQRKHFPNKSPHFQTSYLDMPSESHYAKSNERQDFSGTTYLLDVLNKASVRLCFHTVYIIPCHSSFLKFVSIMPLCSWLAELQQRPRWNNKYLIHNTGFRFCCQRLRFACFASRVSRWLFFYLLRPVWSLLRPVGMKAFPKCRLWSLALLSHPYVWQSACAYADVMEIACCPEVTADKEMQWKLHHSCITPCNNLPLVFSSCSHRSIAKLVQLYVPLPAEIVLDAAHEQWSRIVVIQASTCSMSYLTLNNILFDGGNFRQINDPELVLDTNTSSGCSYLHAYNWTCRCQLWKQTAVYREAIINFRPTFSSLSW